MTPKSPSDAEIAVADRARILDSERRLGQVYTPDAIAGVLAGWLSFDRTDVVRVLDPGAGNGALSESVVRALSPLVRVPVEIDMVELDNVSARALEADVVTWTDRPNVKFKVIHEDFITQGIAATSLERRYTHAILNPPYSKLSVKDPASIALAQAQIEVSNVYAAFVWLAIDLLEPHGQLVAILPRSFCNGEQFKKFRRKLMKEHVITHLHAFTDRDAAFSRDHVLQETVMIRLAGRGIVNNRTVQVSWSPGGAIADATSRSMSRSLIVDSAENDFVIRIPDADSTQMIDRSNWKPVFEGALSVSTGSVVDFRTRAINETRSEGSVLLVGSEAVRLPSSSPSRPSRYLQRTQETARYIYPAGSYVVIKRVSPKEQSPRLRVAIIVAGPEGVAFENHVNVVHRGGKGLTRSQLAWVIACLQHEDVERQFRELSGSTQVNVGDLLRLKAPPERVNWTKETNG